MIMFKHILEEGKIVRFKTRSVKQHYESHWSSFFKSFWKEEGQGWGVIVQKQFPWKCTAFEKDLERTQQFSMTLTSISFNPL